MRVAVISVPKQRREPPDYVTALAKGMEAMGHRVDIIDAWTDNGQRLPGYEYIAVVAEQTALAGGKIPVVLSKVLAAASGLMGKRSAAFLKKTGPFTTKGMNTLMKTMEKEGMFVNWSDIILSAAMAEALGKRIGA